MSFEEQEYFIDKLNSNELNSDYHLISINENVDFGYFWAGPKAGKYPGFRCDYNPSRYYLIKYNGKYCSIVYDTGKSNLQVFTKKSCRGKQITYHALKNTILCHLKNTREYQEATTTSDNETAQKLLIKLGFEFQKNIDTILFYKIDLSNFPNMTHRKMNIDIDTLSNYELTVSKCFESLEVIEKHLLLYGNHEVLQAYLNNVLKMKGKILDSFHYYINQEQK